ncbi:LysM domain-containing protein [Balneicella halophila]|uniref:LysM domain-containing protein n=1 Tax=Balneicella halophila TaxID=1537566 RepID=A0A7L4UP52_BALHA|nr:LysM peptidoglycan-binding domain-containing protein [Balneicella halophila]PVX50804.1 LysM domain-containing protein [Balneicella halophila]
MRKMILMLALLVSISFAFSQVKRSENLVALSGKKYYVHKVEPKQTMYAISKTYAVSISKILEVNDKETTDLKEGELLKIPYTEPTTVIQSLKYKHYIVKKGDTLYSLAKKFGTTEEELINLNAGVEVALVEGRRLIVPLIEEHQPRYDNDYYYHIVKPKETLSSIGRRYNISLRKLKQLNEDIDPQKLKPEDEVRIPIGKARAEVIKIGMVNKKTKGLKEVLIVKDGSKYKGPLTQIPKGWVPQKPADSDLDDEEYNSIYDVEEPTDYEAEFKRNYEMVVLLPLKNSFSGMTNYYKGMLLAIQENENVPVTINVYDSGRSKTRVRSKLKVHRDADFIVGPYSQDVFPASLSFANDETTVVSLLSKNNAVYTDENVLQFNTTENSINHRIAAYIVNEHITDNVICFNGRSFQRYTDAKGSSSEKIKRLATLINSIQDKGVANETNFKTSFEKVFDKSKKNIVIVPESNHKVVNSVLNVLNVFSMHDVEVVGYYKWKVHPNIDPEMLFNLNFTYFTPFHYLSTENQDFTTTYKERFLSFPDDFSYMGYITMSKLLKGINSGGKYFYKKPLQKIMKHKNGGYESIDLHKVQFNKNFSIKVD